MLSASSARWSAAERPSASEMAASVSGRNTEAAPLLGLGADLLVVKHAQHRHHVPLLRRQKALGAGKHTGQIVQPGADTNSPSGPQTVPGWLLYSTRSPATTSSGAQSAVLATSR